MGRLLSNERGDSGGVSRDIRFAGLVGVEEKDFCSSAAGREGGVSLKICRTC